MLSYWLRNRGSDGVTKFRPLFILSLLAQGHQVQDQRLLQLDLTIPLVPDGQRWSHDLAATAYKAGTITDQQYGYIVAYLDSGLDQR